MHLKLRSKLLLSFIFATVSLIVALFFLMHWSFNKGAESFIEQQDQRQLTQLSEKLAVFYQSHKNWDKFKKSPELWQQWLLAHASQMPPFADGGFNNMPPPANMAGIPDQMPPKPDNKPPPARNEFNHTAEFPPRAKPFYLLTEHKQPVAGPVSEKGKRMAIISLTNPNQIIGYLGIPPQPNSLMMHFKKSSLRSEQMQLIVYLLIGAFVLSVLVAVPLSALLTKRIGKIHQFVSHLTQGDYQRELILKGKDEISLLAEHLNALAGTLDKAEVQRKQLTADISHELRTPVAIMQANIEAMQDNIVPLNAESVDRLHAQILRLAKLIDDLYQLSLADIGELKYQLTQLELNQLVDDVVKEYQPVFNKHGLALDFVDKSKTQLYVNADYFRLKQALANILDNSLKYTDAPGQAVVRLSCDANLARISVYDSAPGVDANLHARLSERLFRAEKSRNRNQGGAGLGLNLVASIIEYHQGKLNFSHSELGGLNLEICLPLNNQNGKDD
ncbi:ATP-binding protein [Catenovulum sp. 2E275]|uniref:ATP-binding protein n=1 Tax=Catenovulum sp. 2E275 TaxID=2980497 RepID=UPI0021D1849A|nr:ATP-binding protein [Catenovulum sp. 2E275]MCU4677106.1 ATP-binding protein [Catenovulum sp. 2E275]